MHAIRTRTLSALAVGLGLALGACVEPASTVSLSVATSAITDPVPNAAGRWDLRFDASNGDQRAYILRLPAGYNPARPVPYPLVLLFHGAGQSADSFYGRPGMVRMAMLADAQGKILVFAQAALGPAVNVPGAWDTTGAFKDDLLYASELLPFVLGNTNADPARVLAAGFSNGGHFTHFLGATTPAMFRGIGVVEGYYGSAAQPPPAAPPIGTLLPVYIVHGDADATVPIGGGGAGGFTSAAFAYASWYNNDTCTALSAIPVVPPANFTFEVTGCKAGAPTDTLRFTTVFGLGHLWPVAADGFDASARMLAWFNAL
jgi:poly(3-hydroxybutyrate) depolymerase